MNTELVTTDSKPLPDQKISGSGTVIGGEYNKISISGSGKYTGDIVCREFHASGSAKGDGSITASEEIHCSGSLKGTGDLKSGDIRVSGSAKMDGNVTGTEEIKVSGSLTGKEIKGGSVKVSGSVSCNSLSGTEVKISGGIRVEKDLEADHAIISGSGYIHGLLNAEVVEIGDSDGLVISFGSDAGTLRIGAIGGSSIHISKKGAHGLFFRKTAQNESSRCFVYTDTIEGDEIELDGVQADCVRGHNIIIHRNCRIGQVEYSGTLEVEDGAEVSARRML